MTLSRRIGRLVRFSVQMVLFIALGLFMPTSALLGAEEAVLSQYRNLLEKAGFPENDESRRLLSDAIAAPAYSAIEAQFRIIRQISDGRLVQFEVRKGVREWYLIFRNQRGNEPRETYPIWGRGTWIIKKDLLTGEFLQAKVFLQDDEDSFVRIFPTTDGRARLDVHLYGRQIGDDVVIPVPFESLVLSPFARIAAITDRSVPWEMLFPDPDSYGYRLVEHMVLDLGLMPSDGRERASYPDLIIEVDDAAVNGGGQNIYIENGMPLAVGDVTSDGTALQAGKTGMNCSGYVKWVADGLYAAWAGIPGKVNLDIAPLRETTGRRRSNPWSESRSAVGEDARKDLDSLLRDPYFGLDWNRNLAYAVEESRLERELRLEEKAALDTGELPGIPFRTDMGYELKDLDTALYQLAAQRPGAVYFAAVNSRFLPEATADDPNPIPLHQYWHVSVLAPWFDNGDSGGERGRFRVAVLDVGDVSESLLRRPGFTGEARFTASLRENAAKYARLGRDDNGREVEPEVLIHLVRVEVSRDFEPAPLPEVR